MAYAFSVCDADLSASSAQDKRALTVVDTNVSLQNCGKYLISCLALSGTRSQADGLSDSRRPHAALQRF